MIELISVLIVAKVLVVLFEDGVAAWRGEIAPRLQARERRLKASGRREPTHGQRARGAVAKYLADVVEDATVAVHAAQRRKAARRHAKRGHGPVLVDFDQHAQHWYATCDLCGWSGPARRVEDHARTDAQNHAEDAHGQQPDPDPDPGEQAPQPEQPPTRDRETEAAPKPWKPTVIDGGKVVPLTKPAAEGSPVNTEAQGPDSIRAAFNVSFEWTVTVADSTGVTANAHDDAAEAYDAMASTYDAAADNYEGDNMAASTVDYLREAATLARNAATHMRTAAEAVRAASSSLTQSGESLQAGLSDFNQKDGMVAEAVADAGNLASAPVLVG